jgi:hypothetical protein
MRIGSADEAAHHNHSDKPFVQWIPFKVDAGAWAYVDGTFIRFESGSVTFIDVGDIAQ